LSGIHEIHNLAIELNIFEELSEFSEKLCESRARDYKECIEKDAKQCSSLNYIISFVGDDEIVTTDSYSLAPTLIAAGPVLFEVRLSMSDVGFSHEVGNYAEGFILMPITSECSFDAVNRRHQGSGIPFILDHVKLKQLSAVRKQSELDLDFESKYSRLVNTASWVNTDWFTYPFHQSSLVIATAIFDFRSARNFPFLFPSEGGCGGFPPFNNLDTVRSALHYFNSGRSQSMILEIMKECCEIHKGTLKPQDNLFLRGTHLAQAGEEVYKKYLKSFRFLRKLPPEERSYWTEMILDQEPLPASLEQAGATIDSEDFLMGSTISQLRTSGLLMTDLDVRIAMMNQLKIDHLLGDRNMGEILKELEQKKKEAKELPWKELPKYISGETDVDLIKRDLRKTVFNYIQTHMERPFISSFHYQDKIKIFSAIEVKNFLLSLNRNLRSEVIAMLPITRGLKKSFKTEVKERQLTAAEQWIQSKPLQQLFDAPIPHGIGPDDSRIIREALRILGKSDPMTTTKIILVVSNDIALFNEMHILMHRYHSDKRWKIARLDVRAYLTLCSRKRNSRDEGHMFNWLSNRQSNCPEVIRELVPKYRDPKRVYELSVFYDSANISRSFDLIDFKNSIMQQRVSGYLPRGILEHVPELVDMPFHQLKDLPFWTEGITIVHRKSYELSEKTLNVFNNDLPLMWR
jgi:hypothetical protein